MDSSKDTKMQNPIKKLSIASDGTVIEPNFHDARVVGILCPSSQRALLLLKDTSSAVYCLDLKGVNRLRVDDFREGNIVLDLTIEGGHSVRPEDVAHVLGIQGNAVYDEYHSIIMQQIGQKELFLVRLNPSYGCELGCLCAQVDVLPDWQSSLEIPF
jgi:hypothetical protein